MEKQTCRNLATVLEGSSRRTLRSPRLLLLWVCLVGVEAICAESASKSEGGSIWGSGILPDESNELAELGEKDETWLVIRPISPNRDEARPPPLTWGPEWKFGLLKVRIAYAHLMGCLKPVEHNTAFYVRSLIRRNFEGYQFAFQISYVDLRDLFAIKSLSDVISDERIIFFLECMPPSILEKDSECLGVATGFEPQRLYSQYHATKVVGIQFWKSIEFSTICLGVEFLPMSEDAVLLDDRDEALNDLGQIREIRVAERGLEVVYEEATVRSSTRSQSGAISEERRQRRIFPVLHLESASRWVLKVPCGTKEFKHNFSQGRLSISMFSRQIVTPFKNDNVTLKTTTIVLRLSKGKPTLNSMESSEVPNTPGYLILRIRCFFDSSPNAAELCSNYFDSTLRPGNARMFVVSRSEVLMGMFAHALYLKLKTDLTWLEFLLKKRGKDPGSPGFRDANGREQNSPEDVGVWNSLPVIRLASFWSVKFRNVKNTVNERQCYGPLTIWYQSSHWKLSSAHGKLRDIFNLGDDHTVTLDMTMTKLHVKVLRSRKLRPSVTLEDSTEAILPWELTLSKISLMKKDAFGINVSCSSENYSMSFELEGVTFVPLTVTTLRTNHSTLALKDDEIRTNLAAATPPLVSDV